MDERRHSINQIHLADDRRQVAVMVELCRKHVRKFPKDGFGWLHYGSVQIDLFQYATAERALHRAIMLIPKKALRGPYAQMGHLFKKKGDYKQAAFWYRKAVRQKPQDATYHIFLADNAFNFGFLKQAEKHFRNALNCSEGAIDEAYFNLGGISLGKRNYPEAIKCYHEALKIDPRYKIAKERLEDAELALFLKNSQVQSE
jgi:tetratricopeptide (TPR) repeat protein